MHAVLKDVTCFVNFLNEGSHAAIISHDEFIMVENAPGLAITKHHLEKENVSFDCKKTHA